MLPFLLGDRLVARVADPDVGMDIVLGDAFNGGHIIYRQAYGKKNKYETIVTHWSVGPVHSIDTLYVDNVSYDVVGNVVQIADRGNMWEKRQLGLCPEPNQLLVPPVDPYGWTAQHKLSGKAATMITFVYDAKGSVTFTSTPAVGYRGKGMLCYDARKDSTYPGGSGPHRIGDETTREWSNNPFVVAHTYCLGWHQNGKLTAGVGLSTGIITDMFVEGANVCDINGWTCGGVKSTTDDKWDTLKDILQAGGGEPIRLGAQLGCIVKTPRVSLATIDKNCLAKGKIVVPAANARRDRINTVSPRYWFEQVVVTQDTSQKADSDGNYPLISTTTWAQITGTPITVDAYVTADGRIRRKAVDYAMVQCFAGQQPDQVAQLARYDIEDAREFSGISIPLKLRWMGYKPGDVVTVNLPEAGLTNQDVLLLNRGLEPSSSVVTMTARTETAAKHAFALGQTTTPPAAPSVAAPDLSGTTPDAAIWTATGTTLSSSSGSIPALVVAIATGVTADALDDELTGVDAIIIEYRTSANAATGVAAGGWQQAGIFASSITSAQITSVASGTAYDVAISYRVRGVIGDRLTLGPETAGALSTGNALQMAVIGSWIVEVSEGETVVTANADGSVVITNNTRRYPDGHADVAVNGATIASGLAAGAEASLAYDDPTRVGGAVTYVVYANDNDAHASAANPGRHYMGYFSIPSTGSAGGGGGGVSGGRCVTDDTPILMADAYLAGPGMEKVAADVKVGDWVWTQHEITMALDAYQVTAIEFADEPVFKAVGYPRATAAHLFWKDGGWVRMDAIGTADGTARIAKITVDDAHTYVSAGVLSHNIKANSS